jgi:hypothetical protein
MTVESIYEEKKAFYQKAKDDAAAALAQLDVINVTKSGHDDLTRLFSRGNRSTEVNTHPGREEFRSRSGRVR